MRAEIPGDSGRDTVEWLDDLIENASRRGRGKLKWLLDSVRSEIVLERDLAEENESRRKTGGK
ncbi:MAG: hypothetical protein ACR2GU_08720 [Rubrobacteraceae bacterium]